MKENLGFAVRAMDASPGASGAVPDPAPVAEPRRVSLLHATHHAAEDALAVRRAWLDRADRPDLVEHLFAIDSTDHETIAATDGLARVITPKVDGGVTAVQNWNAAAAASSGELLVVIADDLYPPEGWDSTLAAIIGDLDPEVSAFAVKVHDSPVDDVLLRHPVLSRAFFARHGLWSPTFRGLYCDNDLTLRAFWHAAILDGSALVLDHRHPNVRPDVVPSTSHRRMNAEGEYTHGRSRFEAAWNAEERTRPVLLVPADRSLSDDDLHRGADTLPRTVARHAQDLSPGPEQPLHPSSEVLDCPTSRPTDGNDTCPWDRRGRTTDERRHGRPARHPRTGPLGARVADTATVRVGRARRRARSRWWAAAAWSPHSRRSATVRGPSPRGSTS